MQNTDQIAETFHPDPFAREENPFSNAQAEWLTEGEDDSGSLESFFPPINFCSESPGDSKVDPLLSGESSDPFAITAHLDSSEFEAGIASLQGMWTGLQENINQTDTSAAAEALASTVGTVLADMEANVVGIVGGLNSLEGKEIEMTVLINLLENIPGEADGGPVSAGHPYIVGERGFELFVPSQSGQIIPHNETKQMLSGGGGTVNIYASVTIQAADGASLQQLLEELS